MESTKSEELGPTHTDGGALFNKVFGEEIAARHEEQKLYAVMLRAYTRPFSVKSDFARDMAGYVAQAACMGYITTRHLDGRYGQSWYITVVGLDWLWLISEEAE